MWYKDRHQSIVTVRGSTQDLLEGKPLFPVSRCTLECEHLFVKAGTKTERKRKRERERFDFAARFIIELAT